MPTHSGLLTLWTQGDAVTRCLAIALLVMSLLSWIVMVHKALLLRQARQQAHAAEHFWRSVSLAEGLASLGHKAHNPFHALAVEGREAIAHHHNSQAQLHDALDVSEWLGRCLRNTLDQANAQLQAGLAVLASVGSTAPFVGLLGTVWGIYHALVAIGASGQASIDKLAGPIGEALIMTALGLAVAIPAVLGYNALVRGNKAVSGKLARFAHDLHAYYLTGARVSAPQARPASVIALKKG
jgi:biopolymer transport protein ExbB